MEEFTNRELYLMLKGVKDAVENGFKGVHDRQDKTNGRIGKAEEDIKSLIGWRKYISGGLSILAICFLPIVFIVVKLLLER